MSTNSSKFCCVCKSVGKSEEEVTSHFVKDKPGPDGVVVCPTLLAQECGYCHKKGHTPKYCSRLKDRDARRNSFTRDSVCLLSATSPSPRGHRGSGNHAQYNRSHAHKPLYPQFMTRDMFPNLAAIVFPVAVHKNLRKQQENEEFVSSWAGRSTAYTTEEESKADAEMEEEAEYLAGVNS